MTDHSRNLRIILPVTIGVLAADQITKVLVRALVDPGAQLRGDVFFQFANHTNTGLVGGAFSSVPWVAYVAPPFAFAVLIYLYRHLEAESRWQPIAYGSVLGGAIGNFGDRLLFGGVTDFLQFHFHFIPFDFPWKFYPAFNVADAAINVGVVVLVLTWNTGAHKNVSSPS